MGRASSPLRDRVIFVEGAPRSGTTWLVTLLATHPEIAGVEAESHLFDFGTESLFDNFDGRNPHAHGLRSYLERDQLVDLVRDLCDGVLMAMREHISPGAPFVVEKTPAAMRTDGLDLARKRECYPDAWYVHIVRDREAVVKSLMNAPFQADRSYEACAGLWDRTVGNARRTFGDLERYREISYEDLRDDPGAGCRALLEWLGVDSGDAVIETARALSREQFSDLGLALPDAGGLRGRLKARARSALERLVPDGKPDDPGSPLAFRFARALRERDAETLRSLTAPKFEFVLRRPDGDVNLRGDDGRDALVRIAEDAFGRRYVGEWWASAGGGPGEWWTAAPGKPLWTMIFSALAGDATRVDMAIGLVLEDDLVRRAVVITAGALSGRPVTAQEEV
jgi:Sulfotransferase family